MEARSASHIDSDAPASHIDRDCLSDFLDDETALKVASHIEDCRNQVVRLLAPGMSCSFYVRAEGAGTLGDVVYQIKGEMV